MPGVGVETFADPYVEAVLEHYVTLGRRAWVLDLTTELGIPVFAALSAREGERLPEVIFGFGAHLDPAVALRRCVTEMSQMLATVSQPRKQRRTQLRGAYDEALHWWDEATLVDNPYLVPDLQLQRRGRECFGSASSDDLKDDIDACLAVATRHELRVYVRDMTRADLNISVAKVVVPGLRHFWRRLAPGRLYDAPVMIGRVEAPLAEEDMNPTSLFV
jgi:YcaO-like protein with predicted kinase domain